MDAAYILRLPKKANPQIYRADDTGLVYFIPPKTASSEASVLNPSGAGVGSETLEGNATLTADRLSNVTSLGGNQLTLPTSPGFMNGGSFSLIGPGTVLYGVDVWTLDPGQVMQVVYDPEADAFFTVDVVVDQPTIDAAVDASVSGKWFTLVTSWTTAPVQNATLPVGGGTVFDYTYGTTVYYRFVPDPYDPAEDKFYLNYVAGVLSAPIASRGFII